MKTIGQRRVLQLVKPPEIDPDRNPRAAGLFWAGYAVLLIALVLA